ncbi:MAG: hypothetical protein FWE28_01905 [Oscillospiraceae bacterium]|nr:hypothetical protein [Oscillospiraceae bacterium]
MKQWLGAECFPRGTWPSTYSPSLMQQISINLAVSKQDIFSVNGPPGTGKTTLLKEIIASNIVERAALMAKYLKPDDAFTEKEFTSPPDQYNKKYDCPDAALTAFEMLVASNNNAAVENISMELPKVVAKDRTGHFTDIESPEHTYFSDIATALCGNPSWGLFSARLGKSSNLKEFREKVWWADGTNLQEYYKQAPDWNSAKQNFLTAWDAVGEEREKIAEAQNRLEKYATIVETENSIMNDLKILKVEIEQQTHLCNKLEAELKEFEESYLLHQQNVDILQAGLSWGKRQLPALFKKDIRLQELKKVKLLRDKLCLDITRQRTALNAETKSLTRTKHKLQKQESHLQQIKGKKQQFESALELDKLRFGSNYADNNFFQGIQSNDVSQSACPWTDNTYDTLREELFYHALMLQKAFVLNSSCIERNLRRLFAMWDNKFTPQDRELAYGSLLNTLFFLVPVISTTFASIGSFLEGVQPGELGILLIVDEAGQATPQSALGAFWRTQKAIVVGDPLQVEPIMTTPLELCRRFAADNDLPVSYRIPELSVQVLADAQNPYGGTQKMDGQQLWLGCPLVVHRRCIEPMFSMSNEVAYNNRMFCKTMPPKSGVHFLLDRSIWFDIAG